MNTKKWPFKKKKNTVAIYSKIKKIRRCKPNIIQSDCSESNKYTTFTGFEEFRQNDVVKRSIDDIMRRGTPVDQ